MTIKTLSDVSSWFNKLIVSKATHVPPDNLSIQGHCAGVQGRAWLNHASGYTSAINMANAVRKAGKLRTGKPPIGAVGFWKGGLYGHVATVVQGDRVDTSDLPNNGRIGNVPRSYVHQKWSNLTWYGWCYPKDIPGWR